MGEIQDAMRKNGAVAQKNIHKKKDKWISAGYGFKTCGDFHKKEFNVFRQDIMKFIFHYFTELLNNFTVVY